MKWKEFSQQEFLSVFPGRKDSTLYIYVIRFTNTVKYRERRRKNRKRDERSWASFTNSPWGTHRGEKRAVKVGPWPYCNCIHLYFRFEPVTSHHAGNILQRDNIIIKESVHQSVENAQSRKAFLKAPPLFPTFHISVRWQMFREIWEIRASVSLEEGFKPSPTYPTLSFH